MEMGRASGRLGAESVAKRTHTPQLLAVVATLRGASTAHPRGRRHITNRGGPAILRVCDPVSDVWRATRSLRTLSDPQPRAHAIDRAPWAQTTATEIRTSGEYSGALVSVFEMAGGNFENVQDSKVQGSVMIRGGPASCMHAGKLIVGLPRRGWRCGTVVQTNEIVL